MILMASMIFETAVMLLSGASCMEELPESELERYEYYRYSQLDLNSAGLGKLSSCGFFSDYQCASIIDYRSRNGDILSFNELALVDGIGERMAEALRFFVVLRPVKAEGFQPHGKRGSHEIMFRSQVEPSSSGVLTSFGLKYAGHISGFLDVWYSSRTTYSSPEVTPGTFSVSYYGKRCLEKLVAGDFNMRFGQGLCLWSGTTMSGVGSAGALRKSGTGISSTGSFSGGHRGVAATLSFPHHWKTEVALSVPGLRGYIDGDSSQIGFMPVAHTSFHTRNSSFGATVFSHIRDGACNAGGSFDWSVGAPDLNFYGELAWSSTAAGIAGVSWCPSYGNRLGLALRWYPQGYDGSGGGALRSASKTTDEIGAAAAATGKWYNCTVDYVVHPSDLSRQCKVLAVFSPEIAMGEFVLLPSVRCSSRLRSDEQGGIGRQDLRGDLELKWRAFSLSGRYNAVYYSDFAWMWYVGLSYSGKFSLSTRWTLFKADNWDDRIYSYEHDIPGNYTCPALYGRGWNAYILGSYRFEKGRFRSNAALRLSYRAYPWNLTPKSSVFEVKVMFSIKF